MSLTSDYHAQSWRGADSGVLSTEAFLTDTGLQGLNSSMLPLNRPSVALNMACKPCVSLGAKAHSIAVCVDTVCRCSRRRRLLLLRRLLSSSESVSLQ